MGYVEELRKLIGTRTLIAPGVRAVIRDDTGAVLLQLRGDFKIWGLPAGGMELDESVQDAVRREVFEETGLTIVRARPFGIYSHPRNAITYPNGDQAQPFTIAFLVEEWTGSLVADGDESLDLRFFPVDGLPPPEQMHPPHRSTVHDLLRFLETGEFVVD
jgi:8-oxo-dGTP pyrophosphatase MutT (NUDIX family)